MGFLAPSLAIVCTASACYAPALRDCSVHCNGANDCAGEQVCSSGYCVSSAEQQCATSGGGNGGGNGGADGGGHATGTVDAGAPSVARDAAIDGPPDAQNHGTLDVSVAGKGVILVQGVGACASSCRYSVPLASTITAIANANEDFEFDEWTTGPCAASEDATCTFVSELTINLRAKFRKD